MNWICQLCGTGRSDSATGILGASYIEVNGCEYCKPKENPMTEQNKPLTFEVGKYYRSRGDIKLLCTHIFPDGSVAVIPAGGANCVWRCLANGDYEHNCNDSGSIKCARIDKPVVDWPIEQIVAALEQWINKKK
jgi:hypothetical protein